MTRLRLKFYIRFLLFIFLLVSAFVLYKDGTLLPASAEFPDAELSFLHSFGWETETDIVESVYITLPERFDTVYLEYNALQKKQGFDLEEYKGKNVRKNVYHILNYPGLENDESIIADVYSFNGKIIGADICCVRLDGFIHGVNECFYGKNEIG